MGNLCNLDGRKKDKEIKLAHEKRRQMSPLNLDSNPNTLDLKYELNKVVIIQKMFRRLLQPGKRKQLQKELNSHLHSAGVKFLTLSEFENCIPLSYKEKYETLPKDIPEEIYHRYYENEEKFMKFPILYPDGSIYFGEMTANGLKHGYGVFIDQFKHTYEGLWANDQIVYGREYYLNGTIYEGKFVNFLPNDDYGKIVYNDGDFYSGSIKDNKKDGMGQLVFNDGTIYVGRFVNDHLQGKGKITWPDNNIYEGDLENGVLNGFGKFITSEGNVYEGEWRGNQRHGNGKFTWANGSTYVGEYVRGRKEGQGVYKDKLIRLEGEWKSDKPHGKCYLTRDGKEVIGLFRFGKLYSIQGQDSKVFENIVIERENMKDARCLPHIANLSEYSADLRSDSHSNIEHERISKEELNQPIMNKLTRDSGSEKEYNLTKEKGYEREDESEDKSNIIKHVEKDYKQLIENVNSFNKRVLEQNKEVIIHKETQTTGIKTDETDLTPEKIEITSSKGEMTNPFKAAKTLQKNVNKGNYTQRVNFN
jgi:hypothetical protein